MEGGFTPFFIFDEEDLWAKAMSRLIAEAVLGFQESDQWKPRVRRSYQKPAPTTKDRRKGGCRWQKILWDLERSLPKGGDHYLGHPARQTIWL